MRFLVAVDLEGDALATLQQATRLANGAVIDLLYVDPTWSSADFLTEAEAAADVMAGWDRHRVRWQNKLELLLFRLPREVRGRALVDVGEPQAAIVRRAAEYDAVMMGAGSRSTLSKAIGRLTLSERVVRAAPVPVVVLKTPAAVEVEAAQPARVASPDTTIVDDQPSNVLSFRLHRS